MKMGLIIDMGNAAFEDYPNETARILRDLADRLEQEGVDRVPEYPEVWGLYDTNGNLTGHVYRSESGREERK